MKFEDRNTTVRNLKSWLIKKIIDYDYQSATGRPCCCLVLRAIARYEISVYYENAKSSKYGR